jgi:hypothetical protein
MRRIVWVTAALVFAWTHRDPVAAQVTKKPAGQSREKAAAKYQVDVRVQVAPELEKTRVLVWFETLRAVGAAGVSESPGRPVLSRGDEGEPAIVSAGPGRVQVNGKIGPSGTLVIGSEAFKIADRGRLEALFKQLRAEGVPGPDPASPLWGLSQAQFAMLQAELKQPSNFELQDLSFDAFLAELRGRTKLAIKVTADTEPLAKRLRFNAKTGELALGAALAYVLGQHGLAFEPRQAPSDNVSLLLLPRTESKRPWPVGIVPDRFPGDVAPQLLTNVKFELRDKPLNEVIQFFRVQLKMDVLLDRAGLLERKIDPASLRSTIQIPAATFTSAIRRTLAPMQLKHELRIDEADRPFLWVTYGEPTGLVPTKK